MIVIHCDICHGFGQIEVTDTYYSLVNNGHMQIKLKISTENNEELCRSCWQSILSTAPPVVKSAQPAYENPESK